MAKKKKPKVVFFGELNQDSEGSIYGEIDRTSEDGAMYVVVRTFPGRTAYVRIEVDGVPIINGYMADAEAQVVFTKDRRNPLDVKGTERD